ncbi:MAG TPA: hypothetical protein PKY59_02915 [Pyrinomonadaceae bacterium]|nr:hypothetical protein [Pyrinomonadaceae bacterium]
MLALPVLIIGIAGFMFWRNSKNRIVWTNIAKNLQFHQKDPTKLEMSGIYNNCPVKVAVGARRSGDSTKFFTYCETEFPQNLRLLLDIKFPRSILSKVFESNEMTIGISNFDEKFKVNCYDANVLRQFLAADFPSPQTRNLLEDLLLIQQYFEIIEINDKKVYIEVSGQIGDEVKIKQLLDGVTHLANRFSSARERFPRSDWEKLLLQNWQNFALQNALLFDAKILQIQGNFKNFPIIIRLETDKNIWQTEIKLNFPQSLMLGLKIMPENSVHKALTWLGVQDIESGIKEFDDKFIVKGQNLQEVKHKLKPEICLHLVEIKKLCSDFLIDDNEIFVTFDKMLGDEKMLKSYLEAITATAKRFSAQS